MTAADIARFDHVIGMTRAHCAALRRIAPAGQVGKIRMLLDDDVPDPWYGGSDGFRDVLVMIERTSDELVARLPDLIGP